MTGPGWMERVFTFYTPEGADGARARRSNDFDGGTARVNFVDMPIKCPVAPLEFAFLADWYLARARRSATRSRSTFVTPLDGCLHEARRLGAPRPTCSSEKEHRARDRVRHGRGRRERWATRRATTSARFPFDLLVTIPLHGGAEYVDRSPGLGDALGFVPTDPATLQSNARPNVFALGDATNVPTSKAGSVTHFEGEMLTENVRRLPRRRAARRVVRRPRQLLHRDRLRQGAPDRLQLRDRAAARPLPVVPRADAAAAGIHGSTTWAS